MILPLHDVPTDAHYRHGATTYHKVPGSYDAVTPALVELVDPPVDCPVCRARAKEAS